MNKSMRAIALCVLGLIWSAQAVLQAAVTPSKGELVPGEWNDNWARNKQWAIDNNYPFLSVWSQQGCSFCNSFDGLLTSPKFLAWQAEKKIVMNYFKAFLTTDDLANRDWTRNYNQSSFPFVRFYWVRPDGKIVDDPMGGRGFTIDSLIERLNKDLEGWVAGGASKYAGASFVTGSGADNSLAVVAAKTPCSVYVPIARTNNVDQAGSNQYVIVKADGTKTAPVW